MKSVIVITGASSGFGALAQTLEPDSVRARSPALSRRHRSVSKPRSEYALEDRAVYRSVITPHEVMTVSPK
jgi:NADP-dependent 3-hydroxy acid dehydrogenase YdfG